jgi:hypothetical protein
MAPPYTPARGQKKGTAKPFTRYSQFDAAMGRYVLVHQPDPTLMVRRAAASVIPGGIVAFREQYFHAAGCSTIPIVDQWLLVEESLSSGFRE